MKADYHHVKIPQMGEGVYEATVVRWLKQAGETIDKDEPLIEISTDKVDTEVPSPASGYLVAHFVEEGIAVFVDQVIAQISPSAQAPIVAPKSLMKRNKSSEPNASPKEKPSATLYTDNIIDPHRDTPVTPHLKHRPVPQAFAGVIRSSPLVRKIAKQFNVNLSYVSPTGLGGRITKRDVVRYLKESSHASTTPQHNPISHQVLSTTHQDGHEYLDGVKVRRESMSKIRRLTAEHMCESVRTSPHVTTTFEMDLHNIAELKNKYQQQVLKQKKLKLTYTTFLMEACIHVIKQFPIVNASIDASDILYKDDINLGCAVAIDNGLIVPVLKKVQNSTFLELAGQFQAYVDKARQKKLAPTDVKGGTFTITNPGMFGSLHSQPIINQPQVAILSIGSIVKKPVFIEGEIQARPLCQIGLTFDHRLIDGKDGALFLEKLRQRLENVNENELGLL